MSLHLVKKAFSQNVKEKDDPGAKLLLVAMCFITNSGRVYAERSKLMQMTGLSERSLARKIRVLVDEKFLIQDDVNKFRIAAKLAADPAKLADVPAKLADVPAKLAAPYIENSKNGSLSPENNLSSKEVYPIESLQKHIWRRMQNHPGDPGAEVEAEPQSPERADWWHLVDKKKKLDAQLEALIK